MFFIFSLILGLVHATVPIMQGPTSDNESVIVVQVDESKYKNVSFKAKKLNGETLSRFQVKQFHHTGSSYTLYHIQYKDLPFNEKLKFEVSDANNNLLDSRFFSTLNTDTEKITFSVMSCMNDAASGQDEMWDAVIDSKSDVYFFIGDNTYVDHRDGRRIENVTPSVIWERHAETRKRLKIFRSTNLVPIFAIWDDHDTGNNNTNRSWRFLADAQNIFSHFFPRPSQSQMSSQGPGLSFRITLANQRFLFLDARSYRSSNDDSDGPHIGRLQYQWVEEELNTGKKPTWIIAGDQFFGAHHPYESYQGNHPMAFNQFLDLLKRVTSPVLFIAGDRHIAEVMTIEKELLGYKTFEFTSSPIHSSLHPLGGHRNPRRLFVKRDAFSFMRIWSHSYSNGKLFGELDVLGANLQKYFYMPIRVVGKE